MKLHFKNSKGTRYYQTQGAHRHRSISDGLVISPMTSTWESFLRTHTVWLHKKSIFLITKKQTFVNNALKLQAYTYTYFKNNQ